MRVRISSLSAILFLQILFFCGVVGQKKSTSHQKVIIIMMDGFGEAYYRSVQMPAFNEMEKKGIYKEVPSLMPSVTNVKNAAIITGVTAEKNGITGNVFLNPESGKEEYTEDPTQLLAPTIFQRAKREGVKSILFSCKTKTVQLLSKGAGETMCWETASPVWIRRIGPRPDIYSKEVNYWIMEAALYSVKHDPDLGLIYIHTTDYPMHAWPPESMESKEHLQRMNGYVARLIQAAPDAAILITADHTVNHKTFCWDLEKACATRGVHIKSAISPEKDRYYKHHLGLGGTAYIYLQNQADSSRVRNIILGLKGVDEIITRDEAANRFHLMPGRIGDFVVLGDSTTVFGYLEQGESEELASTYRSHGSLYEARVPLFVYNARHAPPPSYFSANYKLASWLYR